MNWLKRAALNAAFKAIRPHLLRWLELRALYIPQDDVGEWAARYELTVAQLRQSERAHAEYAVTQIDGFLDT